MKSFVFRIRRRYFDAIMRGEKTVEYRVDSPFWCTRIVNAVNVGDMPLHAGDEVLFKLHEGNFKEAIAAVFICGKKILRKRIVAIERIRTPQTFSSQGQKDVGTPICWAFVLT